MNYDKLVNQLREENKLLRLDIDNMRQKLRDIQGDNQVCFVFNLFFIIPTSFLLFSNCDYCNLEQVLRTGGFVKDCINTILTSSDSKEELVKNLETIHSKVSFHILCTNNVSNCIIYFSISN